LGAFPLRTSSTEWQAHREAEKYKHFFEFAPDALVIVDEHGRMVDVNAQTLDLFGYERDELIERPVEMLIPPRLRRRHARNRDSFFEEPHFRPMGFGLDLYGLRKDGTEFPVQISLSSMRSDGRVFAGAAIRDVTEQHLIARALEAKNSELEAANQTKDRFLATMSHELRTPLTAVIGYTGTLLMELPGTINEDQRDQLTTIRSSAKHLLSIINGLLDLARVEAGDVQLEEEPFSCADMLAEIVTTLRPLADEKGIALVIEHVPARLTTLSDRRAVGQILMNLVGNAIKFTDRGSVTLSVRVDENDGSSEYRIRDTGPGIPAEDHERLFAAFERGRDHADREGTGLGLYISQRLADVIGARIGVESAPGEGTCFFLTIEGRGE
jgi:PAS domain S-box-containing protein